MFFGLQALQRNMDETGAYQKLRPISLPVIGYFLIVRSVFLLEK